jgi:hypothetical protein
LLCEDELCDDEELLGEDEPPGEDVVVVVVVAVVVAGVAFLLGVDAGCFLAGGWGTGRKAEFMVVGVVAVDVVVVEVVAARFGDPLLPQAAVPTDSRTEIRTAAVFEDDRASARGGIGLIDSPLLG